MQEVAPEVWLVEGLAPYAINCYLVGDVLIDCATRWSLGRLHRELGPRRLGLIVLTHVHPDHQGCAQRLSVEHGAPVKCHSQDLRVLRGEQPDPNRRWSNRLAQALWAGPACPAAEAFAPEERVAGFRIVHAPGHTAGSVILFRDVDRVAICGDVIMSYWLPGGGVRSCEPFRSACCDWGENRRSIRRLWELQPRLILPGHGPPVRETVLLERLLARWETTAGAARLDLAANQGACQVGKDAGAAPTTCSKVRIGTAVRTV